MQWTVDTVATVDAEIDSLPVALRARLVRLLELIEEVGLGASPNGDAIENATRSHTGVRKLDPSVKIRRSQGT